MNRGSLSDLVGRLREVARPADSQALSDADLLQRWLTRRDEAAFELLVWRHGRLVLSACRRILRQSQDVEDAFQATFLVLVRKAGAIARKQAVASWLHTVACRIASELAERAARLPGSHAALGEVPNAEGDAAGARELRRVLDEEVRRLPEKYRLPFILCHLEGRTNEEAARELGCPLGTVLSRLSRARDRLRVRLTRRGLAPSLLVGPALAGEAISSGLVSSTARAAVALAAGGTAAGAVSAPVAALVEGAIQTMFFAKLKTALAVALSVALLGVGGGVSYRAAGAGDDAVGAQSRSTRKPDSDQSESRHYEAMMQKLQKELEAAEARAADLRKLLDRYKAALAKSKTRSPERAMLSK